jgi:acetyl esterase/lipase
MLRLHQLFALALLAVCSVSATAWGGYDSIKGITYTPASWPRPLQGDLYVPEGAGPFPVVIVVHGGSWQHGDRTDMADICRDLARRGYAAFTVDYRLAPQYLYPAPVQDLHEALAWLHTHAAEHRLDAGRMGGWGYSAGAHLVALLATLDTGRPDPLARPDLRLLAVVSGGTPSDLRKWPNSPIVATFLGSTPAQAPALAAEASPATHITPQSPPFFLYHGRKDTLVEPDQASDMAAALKSAGVPVEIYWKDYYGHILTYLFPGGALDAGLGFLDRHLKPVAAVARLPR